MDMDFIFEVRRWIKSDWPVNDGLQSEYVGECPNCSYNDWLDDRITKYCKRRTLKGATAEAVYKVIKAEVFERMGQKVA